jgi:flagellar hook protein FlgE
MAFQQGLSGLNASSKALDVISNNIANAATVGFKAGQAQFADVYAASLGVGGASQVGIGVSVSAVQQQFSQGNISNSNNPLDIAINGNGFFRMQKNATNQTITYTRNGQFHLDSQGYIINAQKNNLTGYPITNGIVNRAQLVPVQLDTSGVDPLATGASISNPGVVVQINLDSGDAKSLNSTSKNLLVPWAGTPVDLNSFNYSTPITLYDQKGNDHSLTMYFTRPATDTTTPSADKNFWQVHYVLDGEDITSTVAGATTNTTGTPTLEFDNSGKVVTTGFGTPADATAVVDYNFNIGNAALSAYTDASGGTPFANLFPSDIPINFDGSTSFSTTYDVNKLVQDGYPYGRLSGVSVSPEGILQGNYSNGQTKDIAQIVLVNFANPNGLVSMGNNQWSETAASGQALVGDPGAGNRGLLQSSSVEDANVDLTQELVNMITQQRNYQANSQSIKTQDQIMQTLVNLR